MHQREICKRIMLLIYLKHSSKHSPVQITWLSPQWLPPLIHCSWSPIPSLNPLRTFIGCLPQFAKYNLIHYAQSVFVSHNPQGTIISSGLREATCVDSHINTFAKQTTLCTHKTNHNIHLQNNLHADVFRCAKRPSGLYTALHFQTVKKIVKIQSWWKFAWLSVIMELKCCTP